MGGVFSCLRASSGTTATHRSDRANTELNNLRRGAQNRNRVNDEPSRRGSRQNSRLSHSNLSAVAGVRPENPNFTVATFLFATRSRDGVGSLYFKKGRIKLKSSEGQGPEVNYFHQIQRFNITGRDKDLKKISNHIEGYLERAGGDARVDLNALMQSLFNNFPSLITRTRQGSNGTGIMGEIVRRRNGSIAWHYSRGSTVQMDLTQSEINTLYNAAKSRNNDEVDRVVQGDPRLKSVLGRPSTAGPSRRHQP